MNAPSLLLVGLIPEARAVAAEASQLAFSAAHLTEAQSVGGALKKAPTVETELLVLGETDPASLAEAAAATDASGLPRWAVVVIGEAPADGRRTVVAVRKEDWNARLLAQVFHSAARLLVLERANARLQGDLSTIGRRINHDLRTPLTAIYTACEALNETTTEPAGNHAVFTESITTSTNELARLIERVSFMVNASAEPLLKEPISMGDVVFRTLQRLESRILRENATVTQPPAWPNVNGVAAWLEVVWLNLIANALPPAKTGAQIELGWSEAGGRFRFWVNDRGPGVARDKVEKLFHPFHQLHRLNAPRGLGLSLVQRLVELQGGTCGYEPLAGGGAHFFFTLPATLPP